jgi:acyl-CoA thioesterase II
VTASVVASREALDEVVGLLDLERLELDLFRGTQPSTSGQRVFGGQVAAQALVAAARTVPDDRPCHSLHAYFLRPGDPAVPIVYEVDRIRDGRSFTTRRVVAVQHGKAIFHLQASFAAAEPGLEHSDPMPDVPGPDDCLPLDQALAAVEDLPAWYVRPRPLDIRYVGDPPLLARQRSEHTDTTTVWMRAAGPLPEDPVLHTCLVAYASDITLLETTVRPHGLSWGTGDVLGASLDHAMWFPGHARADDWWLFRQQAPWTGGGRGLAQGWMWAQDGTRIASAVQEGLVRPVRR